MRLSCFKSEEEVKNIGVVISEEERIKKWERLEA